MDYLLEISIKIVPGVDNIVLLFFLMNDFGLYEGFVLLYRDSKQYL